MISARYQQLTFVFFMTLLMGLVLSFVFEVQAGLHGVGEAGAFVAAWLTRFMGTYFIGLPVVVVVNPIAKRMIALVVASSLDNAWRVFLGALIRPPFSIALEAHQAPTYALIKVTVDGPGN